jgi:NAD(P)H-hydrate epimerase
MTRAGRAAFELLVSKWPEARRIGVICGTGNNGGDGFVVASLARQRGLEVVVYQVGDAAKIRGDAALARGDALTSGVVVEELKPESPLHQCDVLVDALLGTGLGGPVREAARDAIEAVNTAGRAVLALDIPSGLCADTGAVLGAAVQAQHTISFIGNKRGLHTGQAADYTGDVCLDDLSVPDVVYTAVPAGSFLLCLESLQALLPARERTAHKGDSGRVMTVGGELGTGGALLMASEAALRVGAGLVTAVTRPENVAAIISRCPEVMARGVKNGFELRDIVSSGSVFAVGPGLGLEAWSEQLLQVIDSLSGLRILDADALNHLAVEPVYMQARRDDWILTPHPGEAARLLDTDTGAIQADRHAAVVALQARFGGVVVLKGSGTLICGGGDVFVSSYGGPGMASGGMGDVLTGVIAGLVAQGVPLLEAACYGVCLHGRAGELAAEQDGERGLLATDLLDALRRLVNGL